MDFGSAFAIQDPETMRILRQKYDFTDLNNDSIISTLFLIASFTYGPLLGLFIFGLFTKRKLIDRYVPVVVVISPFRGL